METRGKKSEGDTITILRERNRNLSAKLRELKKIHNLTLAGNNMCLVEIEKLSDDVKTLKQKNRRLLENIDKNYIKKPLFLIKIEGILSKIAFMLKNGIGNRNR